MLSSAALQTLPGTISAYFAGERTEMIIILAVSTVLTLAALWLALSSRNPFGWSLFVTVLLSALMLGGMAVGLLVRDKDTPQRLVQQLQSSTAQDSLQAETARMVTVVKAYPSYRLIAGVVGLIALLGLVFIKREWAQGVAAGLLLLLVAQILIDAYSEPRAVAYLEQLQGKPASDVRN
jgi:hypothetical protein